ncbi:MAG: hypothetical protein R3F59_12265 [Myxococcota bacterium]
MPTSRSQTLLTCLVIAGLAAACDPPPRPGTQIGALRQPDPDPQPPSDLQQIDIRSAVEEAIHLGGLATLASTWRGHVGSVDVGTAACPGVWIGQLPDGVVDVDMGDDPGLSWAATCATVPEQAGGPFREFSGFTHWTATVTETEGARSLIADADVHSDAGEELFHFDGEANDSLTVDGGGWQYQSTLDGSVSGRLTDTEGGVRTGGGFEASWGSDGALTMFGTVTALDGFGPADQRPADAPEVAHLPDWAPGRPRFTSVRFDLTFGPECAQEPVGYVGLRGNEGFWFDVYFLPKFAADDPTFEATGFPYEQIDNVACDGVGTLFARNIDLRALDEERADWSREVAPDFASAAAALPAPALADFVYTLRNLPLE